jgi:hypothetical protein
MKKILRAAATVATSLSLVGGFAGIAGASSGVNASNTGPNSNIKQTTSYETKVNVENTNRLSLGNSNEQSTSTGSAKVDKNTTGGDATSGDSTNNNNLDATVTLTNGGDGSSVGGGSYVSDGSGDPSDMGGVNADTTGPDSTISNDVKVSTDVNVENNNCITITNDNSQEASSGDASVTGNTTGGSATSGAATNSNSTSVSLSVQN